MMGKSGHFIHRTKDTVDVDVGTTYNETAKVQVQLNAIADGSGQVAVRRANHYSGNIQLIRLKCTASSGSPTTITLKGYEDTAGSSIVLPPSSSRLEPSIDGTTFSVSFLCNVFHASSSDDLFLFFKCDAGTVNISEVQVSWFE
jgi:hypothetical protein